MDPVGEYMGVLHPGALAFSFLAWTIAGFIVPSFNLLLCLLGFIWVGFFVLRIVRKVLKPIALTLGPLTIMLIMIHVAAWYAHPESSLWIAVLAALHFVTHIAIIVSGAMALLVAVPIDVTLSSLEDLGLPVSVTYILLATIQLLPSMASRVQAIRQAQEARGLKLRGSVANRLKALLALLGPMTFSLLELSESKALGLEMRGYGKGRRTHLLKAQWHYKDWWWSCSSIVIAAGVVMVGVR